MGELKSFLESQEPGRVAEVDRLTTLLAEYWCDFAGCEAEGMREDKLQRIEDPEWDPPILRFNIERHGGIVLGSSRAEIQIWELDLEKRTATCQVGGYRQQVPRSSVLDVKSLANEVAQLILMHAHDARLKWNDDDGSVRINIGEVISGEGPQQTVSGRRKRFRVALTERLSKEGWEQIIANKYRKRA